MRQFEKNALEWTVFAVSTVLVLGTVGYLAYEALTSAPRPVELQVRFGSAERRGARYHVPVQVTNSGDRSAETVLIRVRLALPDGAEEQADLEIPRLPGRATRHGGVTFSVDPSGGQLHAETLGYHAP